MNSSAEMWALIHFRVISRKWLVGIGNVLARVDGGNGLWIKKSKGRAKKGSLTILTDCAIP